MSDDEQQPEIESPPADELPEYELVEKKRPTAGRARMSVLEQSKQAEEEAKKRRRAESAKKAAATRQAKKEAAEQAAADKEAAKAAKKAEREKPAKQSGGEAPRVAAPVPVEDKPTYWYN